MKNTYMRKERRRENAVNAFLLGIIIGASAVFAVFFALAMANINSPTEKSAAVFSQILPKEQSADKAPLFSGSSEDELLILVNWDNPTGDERPQKLIELAEVFGSEVTVVNPEGSINEEAGYAAKTMFEDALSEGIGKYKITGAYRSVIYQNQLWNEKKAEDPFYGEDPYNDPVKVMPGNMSEHATGLAIDILCESYDIADEYYGSTPEGIWMAENAYKYGFILRYPKDKEHMTGVIYEPWHFRYVGKDAAKEIYEAGLCLEEYLFKNK